MNVRTRSLALCCLTAILLLPTTGLTAPRLKVTDNHRYLQYEDGKPFFYLGDTAWELFHRLNREEATLYLTNRANKGFTVIQAVVLPQLGGANAYGDAPLVNGDPTKPNEAYFHHVDFIVNKAEELGLTEGLSYEKRNFYLLFGTEDKAEGMKAFIDKRKPEWKNR